MDITQKNFRETLPLVFQAIDDADFIAFDTEFSGLRTNDCKVSLVDSLDRRYSIVASDVGKFGLFQFGISCFKFCPENMLYKCGSFTFNLLKKKNDGQPITFVSCVNSLRFLSAANFDFNKLFSDGLTFATRSEAQCLKTLMKSKLLDRLDSQTSKEIRNDVRGPFNEILSFISTSTQELSSSSTSNGNEKDVDAHNYRGADPLEAIAAYEKLEDWNIHSPSHYSPPQSCTRDFIIDNRNDMDLLRRHILKRASNVDVQLDFDVKKLTVQVFASKEDRDFFIVNDILDDFYDSVGFSHIVARMLRQNKILVGHNCMQDLLHMIDKCVQSLPPTLLHFREIYIQSIDHLYDTRLICMDEAIVNASKGTALMDLFATFSKSCVEIQPLEGCQTFSLDRNSAQQHDAGYDSFITGVAFIGMVRRIEGIRKPLTKASSCRKLKVYNHKIHVSHLACSREIKLIDRNQNCIAGHHFKVVFEDKVQQSDVMRLFPTYPQSQIQKDDSMHYFVFAYTNKELNEMNYVLEMALEMAPRGTQISIVNPNLKYPETPLEIDSNSSDYLYDSPPVHSISMRDIAARSTLDACSPEFTPSFRNSSSHTPTRLSSATFCRDLLHSTRSNNPQSSSLIFSTSSLESSAPNNELAAPNNELAAPNSPFSCVKSSNTLSSPVATSSSASFCSPSTTNSSDLQASSLDSNTSESVLPRRGPKRKSGDVQRPLNLSSLGTSRSSRSRESSLSSPSKVTAGEAQEWTVVGRKQDPQKRQHNRRNATSESFDGSSGKGRGKRSSSVKTSDDSEHSDGSVTSNTSKRNLKRHKSITTEVKISGLSLNSPTTPSPSTAAGTAIGFSGSSSSTRVPENSQNLPSSHKKTQSKEKRIQHSSQAPQGNKRNKNGRTKQGNSREQQKSKGNKSPFTVPSWS